MIQLISREEVFYKSWLVDHYISDLQNSLYNDHGPDLNCYIENVSIKDEYPYDHLEAFHDYKEELDDFAILAYVDKTKMDFLTHRSRAFIQFFKLIEVKQLYLLDELKCDWVRFPFSYREKRDAFKSIVQQAAYNEAFILDIDDLSVILPLFHFSGRHSTPVIWFFSNNSEMPIALFLCDDANFHTSFLTKNRQKIASAVSEAGLVMGGLEICRM